MVCFGLVMEHDKSEIFHFSRAHNDLNPELDLSAIGAPTLKPKTYWRYLGFYFDRRLSFKEHVRHYSTKALSTVKAMGMLGNSTRGQLQQLQQPPSLLNLKIGLHRSPWPPSPRPNHLPRLQKQTFLVPNLLLPHLMRISCDCSSLRRHFLTFLKLPLFLCTRRA